MSVRRISWLKDSTVVKDIISILNDQIRNSVWSEKNRLSLLVRSSPFILSTTYYMKRSFLSLDQMAQRVMLHSRTRKELACHIINKIIGALLPDMTRAYFFPKRLTWSSQGDRYHILTNQPLFGGHDVDRPRREAQYPKNWTKDAFGCNYFKDQNPTGFYF